MKKVAILLVTAALLGLGLPGCGGPSVIKLGLIAELTGSMPEVGRSCKNAVELAVEDINDSGGITVAGKKYDVELVVKDSGGEGAKAASAARTLIDEDGVVAIVGPNASSNAIPAGDAAEKQGVVLVAPWSTNPKTTLTGSDKPKKHVFRVAVTASYEGAETARFAHQKLGAGKAAVIYDDTADVLKIQAQDFRSSFTALGGTVVAYEAFKAGDKDFSAQLTAIKNAAPDVIFSSAYYTEVPDTLKQARGMGITSVFVGCDGWSSPDLIGQSGAAIEGAYVFNMYSPRSQEPATQEFVKAYEAAYKTTPDDLAALSYDAVGLVQTGLEKAKSLDAKALADSILQVRDFSGVTGSMYYPSDSRDPSRGAAMVKVENGQFVLFETLEARATREQVVSFVEEAVAYAKKNGKEKALAEFSDPEGDFKRGELYIYAYDFDGNNVAHGGNKAFVGQNLIDMKDPNGVMVIQELIKRAKDGSGWLEYMWENPATGQLEPKVGYVMKVDDTWWLGSGTYGTD